MEFTHGDTFHNGDNGGNGALSSRSLVNTKSLSKSAPGPSWCQGLARRARSEADRQARRPGRRVLGRLSARGREARPDGGAAGVGGLSAVDRAEGEVAARTGDA